MIPKKPVAHRITLKMLERRNACDRWASRFDMEYPAGVVLTVPNIERLLIADYPARWFVRAFLTRRGLRRYDRYTAWLRTEMLSGSMPGSMVREKKAAFLYRLTQEEWCDHAPHAL